jgi:hypothetical protein
MANGESQGVRSRAPRLAFVVATLAGAAAMLALNAPGHLTVDSVAQLYEGRIGMRVTFNPPFMSWLLGAFDRISPGTGLYLAASAALAAASLATLAILRPRVTWLGAVLAAAVWLTPQLILYQGIVWKDVLFANLAVSGFVALALAARNWRIPAVRAAALAAALLALSAAGLARQNGLLVQLLAAAALGAVGAEGRFRRGLVWGAGGLAALLLATAALNAVSQLPSARPVDDNRGLRLLLYYDLVGMVARDPTLKLDRLEAAAPGADEVIHAHLAPLYSPQRIDTLNAERSLVRRLWRLPQPVAVAQWREAVTARPMDYLATRVNVFHWLVAPPDPGRCLPYHVGVEGQPERLAALGVAAGAGKRDLALAAYVRPLVGTPILSHLSYAALAILAAAAMLRRREPTDLVMAALMGAALAFAASFFVISLACDYRYLYFLDIAALVGLLYLAVDPPVGPRPRRKGAAA